MLVRASMHCAGHTGGTVHCSGLRACRLRQLMDDAHAAVMLHSHCKLNHFAQFLFMGGFCFVTSGALGFRGACFLLWHRLSAPRYWYTSDCVKSCLTVVIFPMWLLQCLPDGLRLLRCAVQRLCSSLDLSLLQDLCCMGYHISADGAPLLLFV
jgi:hypothetical protein